MIKVALIDDHELIRKGINKLLSISDKVKVEVEFSDYKSALENFSKYDIDVALVDISLGDGNGFDLVQRLRKNYGDIKVIFLTVHKEGYYVIKAMEIGANGYLYKDVSIDELVHAIEAVNNGKKFFSKEISEILVNNLTGSKVPTMTSREIEILTFIVEGLSTKEIADQLNVSPRTVDSHRTNMLEKFGFKNSTQMVRVLTKDNFI